MKLGQDELKTYLTGRIAKVLSLSAESIGTDVEFDEYGLDSLSVVALVGEIEEELGIEIDPSWLYEFRTINKLCHKIGEQGASCSAM